MEKPALCTHRHGSDCEMLHIVTIIKQVRKESLFKSCMDLSATANLAIDKSDSKIIHTSQYNFRTQKFACQNEQ